VNIVLLGHDDAPSLYALSLLVRRAPAHDYRCFLSGPVGGDPAHAALERLAGIDRDLRERLRADPAFPAVLAGAEDLPAPNSPEGLERLAAAAPDLVVSIRYRRILRDAAIAIPAHGVLNLHSGILPDYKGVMATFWAMLAGERDIGSTLHRIVDAGIDTGPVIGIARHPVDPAGSYLANLLAMYPAGVAMMAGAIEVLAAGRALAVAPQAGHEGRYFSAPDAAAVDRFLSGGLELARSATADFPKKF